MYKESLFPLEVIIVGILGCKRLSDRGYTYIFLPPEMRFVQEKRGNVNDN